MTLGETCESTGVSTHTLRYYERIGLLDDIERTASGHRTHSDDDLGRIEFLTLLRATGMPIARMQHFMDLTRGGDGTVADRVTLLEEHRSDIDEQSSRLRECAAAIDRKLGMYRQLLADQ